jgi:WD40 repeat protein
VADGSVVREFVNPNVKPPKGTIGNPPKSHPGWVYGVKFAGNGKYLISVGNAPENKGYLAVWSVADGKLLHAEELPIGPIYAVAVSPDSKLLGIACGPRGPQATDANAYLLKMPEVVK